MRWTGYVLSFLIRIDRSIIVSGIKSAKNDICLVLLSSVRIIYRPTKMKYSAVDISVHTTPVHYCTSWLKVDSIKFFQHHWKSSSPPTITGIGNYKNGAAQSPVSWDSTYHIRYGWWWCGGIHTTIGRNLHSGHTFVSRIHE